LRAAELAGRAADIDLVSDLINGLRKAKGNTIRVPDAGLAAEKIFARHKMRDVKDTSNNENDIALEREEIFGNATYRGGNSMAVMNYGNNLATSLLTTLERDPAFRNIAYFSMEIALTPEIPTYSGGLGVLAGDILKSAA
ncbi:MAG: hypothetical protein Q4F74_03895, partial [Synergistaceae bacterium]|nr:hypothetical protein [Synergistaceae bacterium]